MPRETRSGTPPPAGSRYAATGSRSPVNGIFRKDGEYWTLGYGGKPFRLKDTKGFAYLAHLLRHPGTEFHVFDLVGGIAGGGDDEPQKEAIDITRLEDAGEMLDEQTKSSYRRRLSELREELEEARELGNADRAEKAEAEIDSITVEISRAVALGGRGRRAGSASDRARQSVAKTIKSVLERIAQSDAALGDISRDASRPGPFVPTSLTGTSRSRGNSQVLPSSRQNNQPRVMISRRFVPIVRMLRPWCWMFRRSRWRNELLLWDGNRKLARFAWQSIARRRATGRW